MDHISNEPREILLESVQDSYGKIQVIELGAYRFLYFGDDCEQSCVYMPEPTWLEYDYNRVMLLAALQHPQPQRALLLGLGAGSLVQAALQFLPLTQLSSIELRPEVVRLARKWFQLPQEPRFQLHLGDANERLTQQEPVDLLWLDLYIDDGPNTLQSQPDFLRRCLARLNPNGWLILNQWSDANGRPKQEDQLQQVFGRHYWRCQVEDGNQILMVPQSATQQLDWATWRSRAEALTPDLGYSLTPHLDQWLYEGAS